MFLPSVFHRKIPKTPSSLRSSSNVGNLSLQTEQFDDARTISLRVTASHAQNILFGRTGQITYNSCPENGVITSGSHEYDMDGTPLITLYTQRGRCQGTANRADASRICLVAIGDFRLEHMERLASTLCRLWRDGTGRDIRQGTGDLDSLRESGHNWLCRRAGIGRIR